MELPFASSDLPGTGGVLKTAPEDFLVDEIPLYDACGEGEHLYLLVQKKGIATFEAIRRIAAALDVDEHRIAYAGLKDAHAITTQWVSLQGVTEKRAREIDVRDVAILDAKRHTNKLKLGHLRGNRFNLRVRDSAPDAVERAGAVLDVLVHRGAPNYFGKQRFGTRGDGHVLGEAMLHGDHERFVRQLLGGPPGAERDPYLLKAREAFDAGNLQEAFELMPVRRRTEKKCLHTLLRFESYERAYFAVPKRMRRLYASSYQSWLFNRILAARLDRFDELVDGDLAMLHRNGAVFHVAEAAVEQQRCRAFEISPTGPLFGTKAPLAQGQPGEEERAMLAETGLDQRSFAVGGGIYLPGVRRSLRIPIREVSVEPDEGGFRIRFALPSGAFATSVLREIMKPAGPPLAPSGAG